MKHDVRRSLVDCEIEAPAGTVTATFRFAPDLRVFEGHFPGRAIVPGVFLIEAARLLAERVTGTRLDIREIDTARFTGELHPLDLVQVRARVSADDGCWHCDAVFASADSTAAKVRIELIQAGD